MKFQEAFKTKLFSSIQLKDINLKNYFFDFILKLASYNPEFYQHLTVFLQNNGSFHFFPSLSDRGSAAFYNLPEKYVEISSSILESINTNSKLAGLLEIALRHELTHAHDFIIIDKGDLRLVLEFMRFVTIANSLFNALHRVFSTSRVNTHHLDSLSELFESNLHPELSYLTYTDEASFNPALFSRTLEVIEKGCFFIDGSDGVQQRYITSMQKYQSLVLTVQTNDLAKLYSNYKRVLRNVDPALRDSYKEYIRNNFDFKMLEFWRQLSESQRNNLDRLIIVYHRIVANIGHDEKCFPEFTECLNQLEQDCLKTLMFCQNDSSTNAFQITNYEIRAVLHERLSASRLNVTTFENLLAPDTKVVSTQLVEAEAPSNKKSGFTTGFVLSFCDALADSIINQSHLSSWKKFLSKNILSAGLFALVATFGIGSSLTEVIVIKLINFVANFAKYYLNLPRISLFGIEFNTIETALTISALYSSDGVYDMIMPILGSVAGDATYHALAAGARFFTATNTPFKPIEQTYNQAVKDFKDNNYQAALAGFLMALNNYRENSPEKATCYYSLASCYLHLEQYQEAVECASLSLDIRSKLAVENVEFNAEVQRSQAKLDTAQAALESFQTSQAFN